MFEVGFCINKRTEGQNRHGKGGVTKLPNMTKLPEITLQANVFIQPFI